MGDAGSFTKSRVDEVASPSPRTQVYNPASPSSAEASSIALFCKLTPRDGTIMFLSLYQYTGALGSTLYPESQGIKAGSPLFTTITFGEFSVSGNFKPGKGPMLGRIAFGDSSSRLLSRRYSMKRKINQSHCKKISIFYGTSSPFNEQWFSKSYWTQGHHVYIKISLPLYCIKRILQVFIYLVHVHYRIT